MKRRTGSRKWEKDSSKLSSSSFSSSVIISGVIKWGVSVGGRIGEAGIICLLQISEGVMTHSFSLLRGFNSNIYDCFFFNQGMWTKKQTVERIMFLNRNREHRVRARNKKNWTIWQKRGVCWSTALQPLIIQQLKRGHWVYVCAYTCFHVSWPYWLCVYLLGGVQGEIGSFQRQIYLKSLLPFPVLSACVNQLSQ